MEVVMLTQNINNLFACLGCPVADEYIVGDECHATLEEILRRLYNEDKYVRGFRRLIANSQVIKKDLLPLFYNVKNDHKILDLIVEILENLMIPVECLLPIDIMIREDAGRSTICQLNWLLTACKEAFLNPAATKAVIDYLKLIIKKREQQLTSEECRSIALCLQLLRNLLHIPEVRGGAPGGGASHHNQIIWNLFTQHVDKVLIQLIIDNSQPLWSSTVVQLISLLYKDQHSNTIYKLLNTWCDTALSESSEDDESNTSPQDQGSGDSSSSMATSDPTSDSSDSDQHKAKPEAEIKHQAHPKQAAQNRMTEIFANGVGRKAQVAMRNKHGNSSKNNHPAKHRQMDPSHTQGMRVCWGSESGLGSSIGSCSGGGGKMECELSDSLNPETNSTSSNEDKEPASRFGKKKPGHQKALHMIQKCCYNGKSPLSSQARKELCRKKLMKRSKTTTMSIKTFLNHTPSEEDISHLLKEFTIDFLLKGYGPLVSELKATVLAHKDVNLDTSHFTWLIMYFLRFAAQLELDLEMISPVLSYDIICFLTYEGVRLCEELEVAKLQVGEDLTRTLQKLYLIVGSLKEIIFTLEHYKKMSHLSRSDWEYLRKLQEKMVQSNDLKYFFILLLRLFDPLVQSHQFLQDVVVANHSLLILMENCPQTSKAAFADHIKQFATEDVMKTYGVLLACFQENGEMVNSCIFTMMHHVAGDLEKVSVLFQPSILKSFTQILKTEFEICDDWSDLVEYVVQKCLKTKQMKATPKAPPEVDKCEISLPKFTLPEIMPIPIQPSEEESEPEWSKEELDSLCWYFSQSMDMKDPIGHISQLFEENWGKSKTRIGIIENLLKQGFIQEEQYKCLVEKEPCSNKPELIQNNSTGMDILEGIQVIVDYLHNENCGFFVKWLQNCLLEACYAKLVLEKQQQSKCDNVEPVAFFNTFLKQPVPLVTWTQELWKVMQLEPSIWLLTALNFHLPTRAGEAKIFARIPAEWTPDHIYVAALILGPLDSKIRKQTDTFFNDNGYELNSSWNPILTKLKSEFNKIPRSFKEQIEKVQDAPSRAKRLKPNRKIENMNRCTSAGSMKFDPSMLQVMKESAQSPIPMEHGSSDKASLQGNSSLFGFFLGSSSSADWLQKIEQLKSSSKVQPLEDKHERMSLISGDERDWDLTSMCVSDEDRHSDSDSDV